MNNIIKTLAVNEIKTEKTMTVREVAGILNISIRDVNYHVKNMYPELVKNGTTTKLTESQIIGIKNKLTPSNALLAPKTDLERKLLVAEAMKILQEDLIDVRKSLALASARIAQDAPAVAFANAVSVSEKCILVRDLAKLIMQNGVDMGEKRLYIWLREHEYIEKLRNMPTQKAMDLKLFEVKETVIQIAGKDPIATLTPTVTTKGQQYFLDKFLCVEV